MTPALKRKLITYLIEHPYKFPISSFTRRYWNYASSDEFREALKVFERKGILTVENHRFIIPSEKFRTLLTKKGLLTNEQLINS